MQLSEWVLIAIINVIAVVVGATFVALTPPQREIVFRVFPGAPFMAWLAFASLFFLIGLGNGIPGSGVVGAIGTGFGAALLFGFSAGLWGTPAAIVGGFIGVFIRRHRLKSLKPVESKEPKPDFSRLD